MWEISFMLHFVIKYKAWHHQDASKENSNIFTLKKLNALFFSHGFSFYGSNLASTANKWLCVGASKQNLLLTHPQSKVLILSTVIFEQPLHTTSEKSNTRGVGKSVLRRGEMYLLLKPVHQFFSKNKKIERDTKRVLSIDQE